MKEQNKKHKIQNAEKIKKEDVALYRIVLLIIEGMIGFPIIGLFRNINGNASVFLCIIGCLIFASGIAILVYFKFVLKKDETGKLITSRTVGVGLSIVGFILAIFPFLYEASSKLQVAFIMLIILGCIYNLYSRGFFDVSVAICIGIVFSFFINNTAFTHLELFLGYFAKIAVFPIAIVGLIFAVMKIFGAKKLGKFSVLLPENRFYAVISAFVWTSVAVCAALLMMFSVLYALVLAYFIVLFIVLGIICTIKLL
jgi:hypothetical protein